ncbi:hypothetical protein A9Q91_06165 [Candidatus Gracilibacteria bacterium 28_42_T64]|nr:hypothetical protein A9Q91_06165 [Candidatus Gracilibacteria bacterium 28_42_T64]
MKKFKIAVSKNQKKFTLLLSSENEKNARDRVHQEGYSILSINEVSGEHSLGHKFIFEGEKNGEIKKGKIIGDDIFKIYLKLRKDLEYRVNILYDQDEENITDEGKEKIIKDLEAEYEIFVGFKKLEKKGKSVEKNIKKQEKKENHENFYLKKELDDVYKLIDFVLDKLLNLIDRGEISHLDIEQKEKLKKVYNSIIKIKKSTNISKIKEVGELALLKIGILELRELEETKTLKSKKLLKQTNKLLKDIGSSKQFIEKGRDINFLVSSFFSGISHFFENLKEKEKEKKKVVDRSSHSYIKTELLLKKYKEKLKKNTKEIIKRIFMISISTKKRDDIFLKRKVIQQNISLFEAKQKGLNFSYTSIVKGYIKMIERIEKIVFAIRSYVFFILICYSIIFIIFVYTRFYLGSEDLYINQIRFNYQGLFFFVITLFIYFSMHFKLKFLNFILNIVFFVFIIIFGLINF